MRDKMRQLLSRKSHPKLSGEDAQSSKSEPFPPSGDLTGQRTFPIRNQRENGDVLGLFPTVKVDKPDNERAPYGSLPPLPTPRSNNGANSPTNSRSGTRNGDEQRKVSERSQFVGSSKSGPPRVMTGATGDKARTAYRRCEDEPIHIPGAVQSFGALIGLKYAEDGSLEVRVASENSRRVLGYGPEQLFALASFLDVLKPDDRDEIVCRINYILSDVGAIEQETRLDVFQMTLTFPYEPETRLWCAMHLAPNPEGLVICEFEEYSDAFYMKDLGTAKILPVKPFKGSETDASPEDYAKSTTSGSKPLPVLQVARQKENKEFSSLDIFNAMTQAQKQIADCKSVQLVEDVVVGIISELTGFHRVMFYRFDAQKNGCVEAELMNPQASTDVFRGLHYPASDIPPQARELYKINRTRILHDRDAETSRLVSRNEADFEKPLDLTHSYLRAMSPIHNKYLKNMGVRSTMSISIVIDSDLWGLIACHGYGDAGIHVSLPIRELCRSIGECAAANIQRLLMVQRIEARKLPTMKQAQSAGQNPASYIATSSTDLLKLVDADFALVSIEDKVRAIGRMEPYEEALAVVQYLQSCRFTTIKSSQDIKGDFPALGYPAGIKTLAGLLLIPLNVGEQNDFLVFFRKGQLRHVQWAGNPQGKKYVPGSEYLEPRESFLRWVETIAGTSKEWTEDQMDTASILAMLYGRFIETWRLKGAGNQAQEQSSIQQVAAQPTEETFNLNLTALTLLESLRKSSQRNGLDLGLSIDDHLPGMVKGDRESFKQLLVYFTENAFKQATSARIEINLLHRKEDSTLVGLKIQDNGPGLSEAQLDDVFQEFEDAQEDGWPLPPNDPKRVSRENNVDIGSIARYVRNANGQILVTSELGKGTVFSVELPFEYATAPDGTKPRKLRNIFMPSQSSSRGGPTPSMPPPIQTPSLNLNGSQRRVDSRAFSPRSSSIMPPDSGIGSPRSYSLAVSHYDTIDETSRRSSFTDTQERNSPVNMNVLIAEEDPMSLRMIDERLSQLGYTVDFAYDGQECHDRFAANPAKVDVILMELKMQGVDGMLSARMIRMLEKEMKHRDSQNSKRVPIIAMSTTLDENDRFDYLQAGFDGWILKPIDFRRLDLILQGSTNSRLRRDSLYVPGQLRQGGWFLP